METKLHLGRTLGAQGRELDRARALVREAHDAYVANPTLERAPVNLEIARAWLAEHDPGGE